MSSEGKVGGVFNVVIETSYRVINEYRAAIRSKFLAHVHAAGSVTDAYNNNETLLNTALLDIPF